MQEGSIVVMHKALDPAFVAACIKLGLKHPPVPSDVVYHEVIGMKEGDELDDFETGVFLDTYPEYAENDVAFDANCFTELMSPGEGVIKEVFEEELVA